MVWLRFSSKKTLNPTKEKIQHHMCICLTSTQKQPAGVFLADKRSLVWCRPPPPPQKKKKTPRLEQKNTHQESNNPCMVGIPLFPPHMFFLKLRFITHRIHKGMAYESLHFTIKITQSWIAIIVGPSSARHSFPPLHLRQSLKVVNIPYQPPWMMSWEV